MRHSQQGVDAWSKTRDLSESGKSVAEPPCKSAQAWKLLSDVRSQNSVLSLLRLV